MHNSLFWKTHDFRISGSNQNCVWQLDSIFVITFVIPTTLINGISVFEYIESCYMYPIVRAMYASLDKDRSNNTKLVYKHMMYDKKVQIRLSQR